MSLSKPVKVKKIYDTIHGFIQVGEHLLNIIDTPEFQRLRDIKQLGATHYVFPSATHTRFEHSIAVSYLGRTMIENIRNQQPELNITQRDVELIEIAGLIHDIGHGPFSHLWDNTVISEGEKEHEERGCDILKSMISKYDLTINDNEFEIICNIVNPEKKEHIENWYYQIIANKRCQLDVDKIDYIQRDSFYIGEIGLTGNFKRLLVDVRVVNVNGLTMELAWCHKLNYEIFSLFTMRYKLHKLVYTHHAVKSHEFVIVDILNNLHTLLLENKINFIDITDSVVFCKLCSVKSKASARLLSRDIPTFVGEVIVPIGYNNETFLTETYPKRIANIVIDKINIKFSSSSYNPMDEILYYHSEAGVSKMKSSWCNVEFNETILRCYNNSGKKNTQQVKHITDERVCEFWNNYLKELRLN